MVGNEKGYMTTLFVSTVGRTAKSFQNLKYREILKSLKMNEYNFFGCIVELLFIPKPEIFLSSLSGFKALTTHRRNDTLIISIHIRFGDKVFNDDSKNVGSVKKLQTFLNCAQQIEEFAAKKVNCIYILFIFIRSLFVGSFIHQVNLI